MQRIAWTVVIGATFLASCFTEGDVEPNDGGDDRSSDGTTTIGAAESSTAPDSTEASSNVTTVSAEGEAEAEVESSEPTSSSGDETGTAPAFCASAEAELRGPIIACTSFDPNDEDLGTWTPSMDLGGQVTVIDEPGAPSPPRALQVSFDPDDGEGPVAHLVHEVPNSILLTRLRFRMELGGCDGPTQLAQIHFGGAQPFTVSLVATEETLELTIVDAMSVATSHTFDAEQLATAGPWAQWELRVDVDSDYVDVLLNEEFLAQITGLATPAELPEPPTVRLGIARKSEGFGCTVLFDDVVVY